MASSGTVEVDPQGDVMLVCGEGDDTKSILVCSRILTVSSKVFKAMLGPHFKEGRTLATSQSIELALPDDDANVMVLICRVLHHRHHEVPEVLGCDRVREVAALVDKYDCAAAFKLHAQQWIDSPLDKDRDYHDLRSCLMAAYHFQHAKLFQQISRRLLGYTQKDEWDLGAGPVEKDWPAVIGEVLALIERRNVSILLEAASIIEGAIEMHWKHTDDEIRSEFKCKDGCNFLEWTFVQLVQQLQDAHLWPVSTIIKDRSPTIIRDMMNLDLSTESMEFCDGYGETGEYICQGSRVHSFSECHDSIRDGATELGHSVNSACYECAKEGKAAFVGDECEHKLMLPWSPSSRAWPHNR